jgi:hypothetical protein
MSIRKIAIDAVLIMIKNDVDKSSDEVERQTVDEVLDEATGNYWELLFNPEFRKYFVEGYPYIPTSIWIVLWIVNCFYMKAIDIRVMMILVMIAVGYLLSTALSISRAKIKLSIIDQALERKKRQQNSE